MKKVLAMFLVISMFALMLAGCQKKASDGNSEGSTPAQTKETTENASIADSGNGEGAATHFGIKPLDKKTTINLAYLPGGGYAEVFYVMDQKGWADELNIDLSYQSFSAGPALMEANASWDMGALGAPGAIAGLLTYDVKTVGIVCYDSIQRLYLREDSPIIKAGKGYLADYPEVYGTPETWAGTTWLLPVGTVMQKLLLDTLALFGLTADDVTIINMDCASALAAFKAGEGDGCGLWSAIALDAEDDGYLAASDINWLHTNGTTVMVVSDHALEEKKEALATVYELYYKTLDWCEENMDEFTSYLLESCEVEGIACSEETAKVTCEALSVLPSDEFWAEMVKTYDDKVSGQSVNGIEKPLLETFDFFVSIGTYTAEQRQQLLSDHKIITEFAQMFAN